MTIPTSYFSTIRRDPSLIAYWRLNELTGATRILDFADKYNMNGFYNKAPKTDVPLIYSDSTAGSKKFGESEQWGEIPDGSPLHLTENFAIESWIVPYETATGIIVCKMNSGSTFANPYQFELESGKPKLAVGEGSKIESAVSSVLPVGSASHIVGSVFRNYISIFVNGIEVETKKISIVRKDGGNPVYIGSLGSNASRFNGLIGEIAIYNSGFSAGKALEHFNIGRQVLEEPFRLTTYDPPSYS